MVKSPVRKSGGAGSFMAVKKFLNGDGGNVAEISADLKELARRIERVKAIAGKDVDIGLSPVVTALLDKLAKAEHRPVRSRLHPARA